MKVKTTKSGIQWLRSMVSIGKVGMKEGGCEVHV